MLRTALCLSAAIVAFASAPVQGVPLSVWVNDHDFTFDVPVQAVYDFAGAAPDRLYVPYADNAHYGHGYTYIGREPTVPGAPPASADPYPLYSGTPIQFAANMDLEMLFTANDGPYTNPGGDAFDISLTGKQGHLTITGFIATQGFPPAPLFPIPSADIVLLDIQFDAVSLLARAGHNTADLVEGVGQIHTILGQDPRQYNISPTGSTFFKFILPPGQTLFPPPGAVPYNPLVNYNLNPADEGRVSGEAGAGLPEPATLALLGLGVAGILARRRAR